MAKRQQRKPAQKKPNTNVSPLFKNAMKKGWEGAKTDMATSIENAARGVINDAFNTVLQKGIGSISSFKLGGDSDSGDGKTKWPSYLMPIIKGEYGVITILGARDSGKTTAAVNVAEARQQALQTPIYFVNYPAHLAPNHITPVHGDQMIFLMEQAEFGSTIIIDDASLIVNSKRGMMGSGIAFENLINTIAHRGILLIITVQDSSDLNKAGLRADAYLLKPPERMFLETERPRMRLISEEALKAFETIPQEEWKKNIFVWVDSDRKGLVAYSKPDWMGRKQAKYRRKTEGEGQNQLGDGKGEAIEGEFRELPKEKTSQSSSFVSPFGDEGDSPLI